MRNGNKRNLIYCNISIRPILWRNDKKKYLKKKGWTSNISNERSSLMSVYLSSKNVNIAIELFQGTWLRKKYSSFGHTYSMSMSFFTDMRGNSLDIISLNITGHMGYCTWFPEWLSGMKLLLMIFDLRLWNNQTGAVKQR